MLFCVPCMHPGLQACWLACIIASLLLACLPLFLLFACLLACWRNFDGGTNVAVLNGSSAPLHKVHEEMAPWRRKPVCESGTIATISRAGRKKEQFRVSTTMVWGPYRQTKVEAEADLLYARDAATHDEFADRLRILHELKATCPLRRNPVCECGTIVSRAGRKKQRFRVENGNNGAHIGRPRRRRRLTYCM